MLSRSAGSVRTEGKPVRRSGLPLGRHRGWWWRGRSLAGAIATCVALAACASVDTARVPYSASEGSLAEVPGMPHVRFYADSSASVFDSFTHGARSPNRIGPISYLALSGGGADGAFGAGFLKGLAGTGRRPAFTIVSGVSTGALMAPFVFLGPQYDDRLADLYTGDFGAGLVKDVNLINGLLGNALVDSDKLGRLVADHVDQAILEGVAAEHRKGRRLFVATTNLDAQRPVVWDMGAIASSGSPEALSLFRQVMAASASIPGLFPPRLVSVEADGRAFKEMHVDGGTMQQIFVATDDVLFGAGPDKGLPQFKDLYVLLNNKVDPVFKVVDNDTIAVGTRSLQTVLKREVRSNVLASYAYAHRHGIAFHTAFIESGVSEDGSIGFDPAYMRRLYDLGEAQGRSGTPWLDAPSLSSRPLATNTVAAR